ncbi:MAG TPA: FG-GAP-like repeat-containing protein [Syntrophobacteraceae bacterium]|nr:FG-GAP-like repeat-containing protein [Syntrophobacteraceae bacterium]
MKMCRLAKIRIWSILCLVVLGTAPCWSAEPAGVPAKVAVLPFSMHTPPELAYLQSGIRDMLSSRLAWQGKVQVLDRTAVTQALPSSKGDLPLEEALRIGRNLKADYVLFGSITALGQSISIDAKMASVAGKSEPIHLYAQTKTLDEVIPKINQFAQDINAKVFARPGEQRADAAGGEDREFAGLRNPELLVPETMLPGDKISYLNPNFIEVTPEGSLRQGGLWRSQTITAGVVGMDLGDVDGDGKNEIVTVTMNKVTVYRREGQGLKTIGTFNGQKVDRFLNVALVDLNRDGRAEIYVSNLRKYNTSRPVYGESAMGGGGGAVEDLASFGLSYDQGKLQVVCDRVGYFLNGVDFPKRGKVLIGQEKGQITEGAFKPGIFEMQLRGKGLAPSSPVGVSSRCNVFNFAKADINGDLMEETLFIDSANRLVVLSASGDQLWKGDRYFAATTNSFEAKVMDRRFNQVDMYAIPSNIVVTDLNKDNIPEIVVTRSLDVLTRFLPEGLKHYERGEIVSLSWDQMGMVENWKTREVNGMISNIRVGDLNNDGTTELVASLIMARDLLKLWESKSTIFSYDLNISPAKTAAKLP